MLNGFDLQALGASAFLIQVAVFIVGASAILTAARAGRPRLQILALSAAAATPLAAFVFLISDTRVPFEDFREAYWRAGRSVLNGPQGLIPMLERGVDGFVNLPILAYLFAPFGLLSPKAASIAFFGIGALSLLAAWALITRAYRLSARDSGVALLGLAAFGPIHYSAREGNTSHILIAVLVAGVMLTRARRDLLAGLVFGAAALIKLPLLLIGVFFLLRGRWKIVAGGLAICMAAAGLSLAVFGWDIHVLWYQKCIAPFGSHPMPAFNVQSVSAAFSKFEQGAGGLNDWSPHALSPVSAILAQSINLMLAGLVAWAIWRGRPTAQSETDQSEALESELMMVIVLACLLSPLSWSHYYSWLALPAVFLLAKSAEPPRRPRIAASLAVGWALASPAVFWHDNTALGLLSVVGNLHLLIGAVVILVALAAWRASVKWRPASDFL